MFFNFALRKVCFSMWGMFSLAPGSANLGAGLPECALKCAHVLPHWGLSLGDCPCASDGSLYKGHHPRTVTHVPLCPCFRLGGHQDIWTQCPEGLLFPSAADQVGPALSLEAHVNFQTTCVGGSGLGESSWGRVSAETDLLLTPAALHFL